jgi:hypothetical protein
MGLSGAASGPIKSASTIWIHPPGLTRSISPATAAFKFGASSEQAHSLVDKIEATLICVRPGCSDGLDAELDPLYVSPVWESKLAQCQYQQARFDYQAGNIGAHLPINGLLRFQLQCCTTLPRVDNGGLRYLPSAVAESRMRSCFPGNSMGAAIRLPLMASLKISCYILKPCFSEKFACSRYSDLSPAAGADCAACCFSYGICTDRLMDEQSTVDVPTWTRCPLFILCSLPCSAPSHCLGDHTLLVSHAQLCPRYAVVSNAWPCRSDGLQCVNTRLTCYHTTHLLHNTH